MITRQHPRGTGRPRALIPRAWPRPCGIALAALSAVSVTACAGGSAGTEAPGRDAARAPESRAVPGTKPYVGAFRELERRFDARLGVYAVDTGTGHEVAFRARERFPYASTIKALIAGAVLRRYTLAGMDATVPIRDATMTEAHSPVTERRRGTLMTLDELADAAVRYSDNTAANHLLDRIGGPEGLAAVLADLGDDTTQVARREPELNDWAPGQRRDTSTPKALAGSLRAFVLGDALPTPERGRLARWLKRNTTGATVIRAGMPDTWVVGDKTGTGGTYGSRNDIAVVWRPDAAPLVMAIMSNRDHPDAEHDDELIAEAASVVAASLA